MEAVPCIVDRDADPVPPKNFGVRADGQRTSNLAATQESHALSGLNTAAQATADLQPIFDSIGLGHKCAAIATAMCKQRHHTWRNGVVGLIQWKDEDTPQFNSRMQEPGISLSVQELAKLNSSLALHEAPPPAAAPPTKCVVRVRCDEVELKLTLTAKFLAKPLADALVAPFLKAFSKRAGRDVTVGDVERVEIGCAAVDMAAVGDVLLRDERGVLEAQASAVVFLRNS